MFAWIIDVIRLLIVFASRHRSRALENMALRQQLAVYRRTPPEARPALVRSAALGRTAKGMAGPEISLGGRPVPLLSQLPSAPTVPGALQV